MSETKMLQISGENVPLDDGAWSILPYEHKKIHDGELYSYSVYQSDLANNGTIALTCIVGAEVDVHIFSNTGTGGNCVYYVIENPTFTGGATVTPSNHNRSSANLPVSVVKSGGTIAAGGTLVTKYLAGGSGGLKPGSNNRSENEWEVGSGTISFKVVNVSGGAINASIELSMYED